VSLTHAGVAEERRSCGKTFENFGSLVEIPPLIEHVTVGMLEVIM